MNKSATEELSIRNKLPGIVQAIVKDKVLSEVVVKTAAGLVTAVITTSSVNRLKLKKGDEVFAMIKATEVFIDKEAKARAA